MTTTKRAARKLQDTSKAGQAGNDEKNPELCDKSCSNHGQMMLGAIGNATPILKVTATLLHNLAWAEINKPGADYTKKVTLGALDAEAMAVSLFNITRRLEETECPSPEEIAAAVAVKW